MKTDYAKDIGDMVCYTTLSLVFSTNAVCVKTQQKHCSIIIIKH